MRVFKSSKNIYLSLYVGFMVLILVGCGGQTAGDNRVPARERRDVITAPDSTEGADNDSGVNETSDGTDAGDDGRQDSDNVSYGELSEGDAAPDFAADLASGEKFVLSENIGKVILLNLWATWCGPCVEEMPAFEKLNSEYGDDVVILGVNCVESRDTVDAFIKENGYTFPIAYDTDGVITHRYPTQGIPYTLVIGKDGIIDNIYLGSAGMERQYQAYKSAIDTALTE